MKSKIFITNIIVFILIGCSTSLNNKLQEDSPENSLFGSWVMDVDQFTVGINTMDIPEQMDSQKWEFGKQMVLEMFKNYYITINEDFTFKEYHPMSENSAGKWSVKDGVFIRDYDMNDLLKKSLKMYEKFKPESEDYDDTEEYNLALIEHQKSIDEMLSVLHQESKYTLNNNHLEIIVNQQAPNGNMMKIVFPLIKEK